MSLLTFIGLVVLMIVFGLGERQRLRLQRRPRSPGAARHAALIGPRGLILPDHDTYQQELIRLGGRVG